MTEFICRLGTPSGEIVTRIVEANAASEARSRLESEGFRVFAVSTENEGLSAVLSIGGGKKGKVKQADFLLFNQQLSALLRAGIPVLQSIDLLKTRSASGNLRKLHSLVRRQPPETMAQQNDPFAPVLRPERVAPPRPAPSG